MPRRGTRRHAPAFNREIHEDQDNFPNENEAIRAAIVEYDMRVAAVRNALHTPATYTDEPYRIHSLIAEIVDLGLEHELIHASIEDQSPLEYAVATDNQIVTAIILNALKGMENDSLRRVICDLAKKVENENTKAAGLVRKECERRILAERAPLAAIWSKGRAAKATRRYANRQNAAAMRKLFANTEGGRRTRHGRRK